MITFSQVLEKAETLTLDEQEELSDVLHRRVLERRRDDIADNMVSAREDFNNGKLKPMSVENIMKMALL